MINLLRSFFLRLACHLCLTFQLFVCTAHLFCIAYFLDLLQVTDTERCVRMICSHTKVNEKNLLAIKILRKISDNRRLILRISSVLEKIACLVKSENLELAHAARTLLIEAETPTYTEIKLRVSVLFSLKLPEILISFNPESFFNFSCRIDYTQLYISVITGIITESNKFGEI